MSIISSLVEEVRFSLLAVGEARSCGSARSLLLSPLRAFIIISEEAGWLWISGLLLVWEEEDAAAASWGSWARLFTPLIDA